MVEVVVVSEEAEKIIRRGLKISFMVFTPVIIVFNLIEYLRNPTSYISKWQIYLVSSVVVWVSLVVGGYVQDRREAAEYAPVARAREVASGIRVEGGRVCFPEPARVVWRFHRTELRGRRLVESMYEAEGGVADCVEPGGWYLAVRGLVLEAVWPVYYVGGVPVLVAGVPKASARFGDRAVEHEGCLWRVPEGCRAWGPMGIQLGALPCREELRPAVYVGADHVLKAARLKPYSRAVFDGLGLSKVVLQCGLDRREAYVKPEKCVQLPKTWIHVRGEETQPPQKTNCE
ncbi:MAG: hypothetical protein QXI84_07545 [Thermofilaceae archaeon]